MCIMSGVKQLQYLSNPAKDIPTRAKRCLGQYEPLPWVEKPEQTEACDAEMPFELECGSEVHCRGFNDVTIRQRFALMGIYTNETDCRSFRSTP